MITLVRRKSERLNHDPTRTSRNTAQSHAELSDVKINDDVKKEKKKKTKCFPSRKSSKVGRTSFEGPVRRHPRDNWCQFYCADRKNADRKWKSVSRASRNEENFASGTMIYTASGIAAPVKPWGKLFTFVYNDRNTRYSRWILHSREHIIAQVEYFRHSLSHGVFVQTTLWLWKLKVSTLVFLSFLLFFF